jgi:ATP-binding cassette subfamily B protein
MNDISKLASRPFAFMFRYVRMHPAAHTVILLTVLVAVACSVTAQYGIKFLVDTLSTPNVSGTHVWFAFAVLASLIAADNLLWRVAGWIAGKTFVEVTGDVRRDLFRHLTGHAPSYFADRLPGTLTSRVSATSNAVYTVENMFIWNVLPPCAATVAAIVLVFSISTPMALGLSAVAGVLVVFMFRMAAAGRPLHHEYADKAATVDGEMIDVIGNLPLVWSFGGTTREHHRFDGVVGEELVARYRSVLYLEKLRVTHAVITIILAVGLFAWAILLWQDGQATTGQVVLVCTLGLSVLHATRDLAVALVDITQHMARFTEGLATLLVPHTLRDHPAAEHFTHRGEAITFEHVSFHYPDRSHVFTDFNLCIEPEQRVGLVGPSGGGKSTIFALLQRFYDVQGGRITIGGQDIARVTQESLRASLAMVPQDISLFHRTLLENIRYGRPDASDEEIEAALDAARCTDFIGTLPQGVHTLVGDRGVKFSPGQRQRIAIARAFLKDAPILLLDEATSALDSESEEAIRQALDRLMAGRTVVAIAHRLSTLRNFDRIVLLRGGGIVEDGPPEKLLRHGRAFREMVERQAMNVA